MIVGHNHHRLEKRITAAMLSRIPYPREIHFLQQMSERVLHNGKNTWLSDRQAERLFVILTRCEQKLSPNRPTHTPRPPSSRPAFEGPEPFRIEDCFVDTPSRCEFVDPVPEDIVPPTVAPGPSAQASESLPAPEPDIGSIIRRVIARGKNFPKRRQRMERQHLKSSSSSSLR